MTWTAPAVERRTFVLDGDEWTQLHGWLDYYRDTLLWKCAGLTADQLKTASVEPSSLTLLGLVRHMADVERGWLRMRSGGEDLPWLYSTEDNLDGDFDDVPTADAAADLEAFRAECAAADAALAGVSLDHRFHHARRGIDISVRWAVNHVIEEYARHCGHADFIRERIDGATGA